MTVTGTPTIQLEVGVNEVQVPYARHAGPALLVFGYTVVEEDRDLDDGVAVPADAILLAGGTIAGAHGVAAGLGHDAVAADSAHRVDGSKVALTLTDGVCERTPQVRAALVAHAQGRDAAVTDCSKVTETHLAAVRVLNLEDPAMTSLKAGDFEGLTGVETLTLQGNALTALPAGIFDDLGMVMELGLNHNALAEGGLPDRVFETLTRLHTLYLSSNPGSASFVPRADAGADLVLRAGGTATLGGPGTGRDPWGTNVDYAWVEVDAEGSPVAPADRKEGLAAADVARPGFTAPALAAERVLRYRLTATGKGAGTTGTSNRFRASDTVTVTVRAAPAVTAVALTSAPQAGGKYRRGERIEVSVTFSAPVAVTGPPAMTPTIGLQVGPELRRAGYFTRTAPNVLVFGHTVVREDRDDDGIAVPADGILLEGGTIAGADGTAALLGHGALAADTAHEVNGGQTGQTGGVCDRTAQVRDALVAKARASGPFVNDCSEVGASRLATMTGTLQLGNRGIAALKPGDFGGLGGLTVVVLSGNALGRAARAGAGAADRLDRARFEPQPRQRGLPAAGGRRRGPHRQRRQDRDAGRAGHGPGSVGDECRVPLGRGRRRRQRGWRRRRARRASPGRARARRASPRRRSPRSGCCATGWRFQGRGHNGTDAYSATDTVAVTVRAAPAVTAVALTSVAQAGGKYRAGERIEVGVTFSAPVTVTGVPRIGLAVGTETRRAFFVRNAGPAVLLFSYAVSVDDRDLDDGVAVPANGLRLAGGTIVDVYGAPAFLGHDAVAADAAHKVDGRTAVLTGGGVRAHAPGARRAGGGGAGERPGGGGLLAGRRRRARRDRGHAAAERSGHGGAEARGLRGPGRGNEPLSE